MFERNRLGNELQANRYVATETEYENFTDDFETADATDWEWEENEADGNLEAADYEEDFEGEMLEYEALNPYGEAGGGRIQNKKDPVSADLVTVQGVGKKVPLQKDAARAWSALVAAARSAGLANPLLLPTSGYRSYAHQKSLFEQGIRKHGSAAAARRWVAPPGGSAHQSGRAIDFYLGTSNSSGNLPALKRTRSYAWLLENARRFGFYPYSREPWHWEYNPAAGNTEQEYETGSSTPIRPGDQARATLVRAAQAEWIAWNRGRLVETDAPARPLLTKYWSKGAGESPQTAANISPQRFWSAAFVSYIMKQAYPKFPTCGAHWQYVIWAKQTNGKHPFTAVRPQGVSIEVGDILVNSRANSEATFDNPKGKASHGDIVIAIDRTKNQATVIGGNVSNSSSGRSGVTVNIKTRALTPDGRLKSPGGFYAVIKMAPATSNAWPSTPGGSAPVAGTAASPTIDAMMRRIPDGPEPRTVAALRPILDRVRGEIPLDYLAGWVAVESSGRNNTKTRLDERGYFQVHPDESKDYGYDHARISTDWKYSVAVGIDLVRRKARRAMAYADTFGYTANSDLYWRVAKMMHWLPVGVKSIAQAMKADGFKPRDWQEFRTYVLTHRDRIKELIRAGNKAHKVWDPMQGIENVEKLYQRANG